MQRLRDATYLLDITCGVLLRGTARFFGRRGYHVTNYAVWHLLGIAC